MALSWKVGKDRFVPRDEKETPPFASFSAASSPVDDFAESFATYVHTIAFHEPYELRVLRGKKVVRTLRSCWNEPQCAAKRAALEAVIKEAAGA